MAGTNLSLQRLSLTYNTSRGPLPALGPLDLDVADGEFVAVLGPSGCGKSTLLKILSGLLPLSQGEAMLGGAKIDGPRQDVGIVFQQPTLLPWKTVLENVLMPVRVLGIYSPEYRRKADELIAMVGLGSFAEHYPHELSGGMQQRVAIARGLIHEPKLLLMDEPFAALDALTREQMVVELQAIWERTKKSVVFITHSIQEAAFMADRIVVLSPRPGRVIHVEKVELPRPRSLDSMAAPEFVAICDRLRRLFSKKKKRLYMRDGWLGNLLLPLGTTALFLVVWHYGVGWLDVPSYLIPTPLSVLRALKRGLIDGVLWPHIWATTAALLIGYFIGCASAILLAIMVSESSLLERATYPLIVAFQSVPKVALAPIIIVWFGFELESKVVMVALICFFPCFINTLVGLKSCNPNLIDLYRAFAASRRQILFAVKLPSATSAIFAGLEISIVMALLGAVMAELVASSRGLGHVIEASGVDFNVAMMFACVIVLAAIGVIASQIIMAVHRRVAFWDRQTTTSIAT